MDAETVVALLGAFLFGLLLGFVMGVHGSPVVHCIDGKIYEQKGSMLIHQKGVCVSLTEDPSIGQAEQQ